MDSEAIGLIEKKGIELSQNITQSQLEIFEKNKETDSPVLVEAEESEEDDNVLIV